MALVDSRQIKAARAMLGWGQRELAQAAGISEGTVLALERIGGPVRGRVDTMRRLSRAIEEAGVLLIDGDSPGVRLRAPSPS